MSTTLPHRDNLPTMLRTAAACACALAVLGCAATPGELAGLSDQALAERFQELHRRVYEVYAQGPEAPRLHDHLARSFAGEQLTEEFLEHYTTVALMARDRTAIDVLRVDYERLALARERDRVRVEADWSVGGVVTHQGHTHPRVNRYRAVYTLAAVARAEGGDPLAALRIVDTRLESLERVRGAIDLARPNGRLPASAAGSLSLGDLLRSGAVELPEG
jgi:hypothetical protein